jgi:hypothetical protein
MGVRWIDNNNNNVPPNLREPDRINEEDSDNWEENEYDQEDASGDEVQEAN